MARVVSSLHAFYKFMRLEGIRPDDPSELIETPKQERALPSVLAPEEVDRFLASIDPSTPRGLRDRALFELIYSCGLRISEAADLSFDRLYLKERVIRVIGKGRKERLVPFGEEAALWLCALYRGGPARPRQGQERAGLPQPGGQGHFAQGHLEALRRTARRLGRQGQGPYLQAQLRDPSPRRRGRPSGPCRSSSGIRTSRRRRSIRISTRRASRTTTGTISRGSE